MSTKNLFTYVNDANIEVFLANEQEYTDKISFLGTTKKIRAKGKEYGGEDNIIETISVNGVAEEITNKNVDITVPTKVSDLINDSGFLNQHQSLENYVTKTDLSLQAYLQSFTESDPTVPVHVKTITQANIDNWNTYANVQADWNVTDSTSQSYIKNKPTIPAEVTESTVSGWGFTKNNGMVLPSYSSGDSGKILSVNSSGQLVWITPVYIYTGSGEPVNSIGNDGDIYLQS